MSRIKVTGEQVLDHVAIRTTVSVPMDFVAPFKNPELMLRKLIEEVHQEHLNAPDVVSPCQPEPIVQLFDDVGRSDPSCKQLAFNKRLIHLLSPIRLHGTCRAIGVCQDCGCSDRSTSLNSVWSNVDPIGRNLRLCDDCVKKCGGG